MGSYRLQGAASPHPPVLLLSIEYHAKSYQKLRHFILPLKKFWDKCNTKDAFTATSWPGKQRHDPSWSHPGKATKNNILSHLIWTDYHSHITFAIPHCPPQSLCTHNPHLQLHRFGWHLPKIANLTFLLHIYPLDKCCLIRTIIPGITVEV